MSVKAGVPDTRVLAGAPVSVDDDSSIDSVPKCLCRNERDTFEDIGDLPQR